MIVKAKNLKEITGKESGILLFDNGDVIICDWSDMDNPSCTSPFGTEITGFGEEIVFDGKVKDVADIGAWLDDIEHEVIYDFNESYQHLNGLSGKLYSNVSGVTVVTPDNWA